MNEIAVTFNDNPDVIEALTAFERGIRVRGGHDNDQLMDLIEAMMKALGLQSDKIDRGFLLRPFGSSVR